MLESNDPRTAVDGQIQDHYLRQYFAAGGDRLLYQDLPVSDGARVVDLGCYQGEFAQKVLEQCNPAELFCIDLNDELPDYIKRHVKFQCTAVGRPQGLVTFKPDGPNTCLFHGGEGKSTAIQSPRELFEGEYDLIKINVEGSEYEFFDELRNIRQFKAYLIQFHPMDETSVEKRAVIIQRLRDHGYVPKFEYPFVWELWVDGTLI